MQKEINRKWLKVKQETFSLLDNGHIIGTIEKQPKKSEKAAKIRIGDEHYTMRAVGFWKNNYELVDEDGQVVLSTYHDKNCNSFHQLIFEGKHYKLSSSSNKKNEWVLLDNQKELMTYSLEPENGPEIKSQTFIERIFDFVMHFLLYSEHQYSAIY